MLSKYLKLLDVYQTTITKGARVSERRHCPNALCRHQGSTRGAVEVEAANPGRDDLVDLNRNCWCSGLPRSCEAEVLVG